jgi:hypothetical protein
VLELPDDERWSFISRIYARDDGQALAFTGRPRTGPFRRMQERMKAGLRTALDERTQSEISLRQCGQTLASTWTRSRQEGS